MDNSFIQLSLLPKELVWHIFSYFDEVSPYEVAQFGSVCRQWQLWMQDAAWRLVVKPPLSYYFSAKHLATLLSTFPRLIALEFSNCLLFESQWFAALTAAHHVPRSLRSLTLRHCPNVLSAAHLHDLPLAHLSELTLIDIVDGIDFESVLRPLSSLRKLHIRRRDLPEVAVGDRLLLASVPLSNLTSLNLDYYDTYSGTFGAFHAHALSQLSSLVKLSLRTAETGPELWAMVPMAKFDLVTLLHGLTALRHLRLPPFLLHASIEDELRQLTHLEVAKLTLRNRFLVASRSFISLTRSPSSSVSSATSSIIVPSCHVGSSVGNQEKRLLTGWLSHLPYLRRLQLTLLKCCPGDLFPDLCAPSNPLGQSPPNNFQRLRYLSINNDHYFDYRNHSDHFQFLSRLSGLTHLELRNYESYPPPSPPSINGYFNRPIYTVRDNLSQCLALMTNLESLVLVSLCYIPEKADFPEHDCLRNLTSLHNLELSQSTLSSCAYLNILTLLTSLTLAHLDPVTAHNASQALFKLTSLRHVSFEGELKQAPSCNWPRLTTLKINQSGLDENSFQLHCILAAPLMFLRLTELNLRYNHDLSDEVWSHIAPLPLGRLDLSFTAIRLHIEPRSKSWLASLPLEQHQHAFHLAFVKLARTLHSLEIAHTPVSYEGVMNLKFLTSLTFLEVSSINLSITEFLDVSDALPHLDTLVAIGLEHVRDGFWGDNRLHPRVIKTRHF